MAYRKLYPKRSGIKGNNDTRSTDKSIVVRFNKQDYKSRQKIVRSIGECQICGSTNLDTPHHAEYGMGVKDDRYLVCICIECHSIIHSLGYGSLTMTRDEIKSIGWDNHITIIGSKND